MGLWLATGSVAEIFLASFMYLIPKAPVEVEYEIKKSRFIAWARPASTREEAMAVLSDAVNAFPDARHHCWAYLLGNAVSAAMSDDGEPSGTAGKPILNVLQHKHVGDIMIVVIRYFGGIKLGAGGLVRAYSTAAQMAMDALETIEIQPEYRCQLVCSFAQEQPVRHWLGSHGGAVQEVNYHSGLTMRVRFQESFLAEWRAFVEREGMRILDETP